MRITKDGLKSYLLSSLLIENKKLRETPKILVCRWGATMTLYQFAQMMSVTPKTCVVRILKTETVGSEGLGQPKVSPVWPLFGEHLPHIDKSKPQIEKRYRLYWDEENKYWFTRKDGFYKVFRQWDGQPKTEDHND